MGTLTESLTTSVAAVSAPVTIAECKEQMGLDYDYHDHLIKVAIMAATRMIEAETNNDICERTRVWKFQALRGPEIRMPVAPVQSITSIQYVDTAGDTQTLATSVWELDTGATPPLIRRKFDQDWPTVRGGATDVTVTFVTGYSGTAASPVDLTGIPDALRQAIQMVVASLYRMPESQVFDTKVFRDNQTFKALLGPFRFWRPLLT